MTQEFNDGHISEAMDRCNTVLVMVNELLYKHPAVKECEGGDLVKDICLSAFELMQKIGELEDDTADQNNL